MSGQDDLHSYLNNHLSGGTGAIEMATTRPQRAQRKK